MRNAIKLMYGGIALSAIIAIIDFAEVGSLSPNSYILTQHQRSVEGASAFGAFLSVFGVACWILMAWANKRGMPWARIVSSILFGVLVLYTLFSIIVTAPAAIIFELGAVAVGLIALMQLWKAESSAFYRLTG